MGDNDRPPLDYAGPRREASFDVRPATTGDRVLGGLAWAFFLGGVAIVLLFVVGFALAISRSAP